MIRDEETPMTRIVLLAACVGAASVAGALLSVWLVQHDAPGPTGDLVRELARTRDDLGELMASHRRLEAEVRELSLAPAMAAPPPGTSGEAPASAGPGPAPADEVPITSEERIDEKVRTAVAESREADLQRIGQRFSSMARQREGAQLDGFVQSQGISPYQREEMEKILERRREAIGAFFRSLFGGGGEVDPATIREKVADVQRESDEALRSLLSPDQYEEWKKIDEASRQTPFGPPIGAPR
jgi:hypothetical protein